MFFCICSNSISKKVGNLRNFFKKKMKNGFMKMSQPDGCLDD